MADVQFGAFDSAGVERSGITSSFANLTGAALSLSLVAGLGVWGYKLTMRDVTGIPVIRALAGPMRIQPQDPGGDKAAHQGLSVNVLQAAGLAAAPADRLVLAPRPVEISSQDAMVRPRVALADAGMSDGGMNTTAGSKSAMFEEDATGDMQTGDMQTGDMQTGDMQTGDMQMTASMDLDTPQNGGMIMSMSAAGAVKAAMLTGDQDAAMQTTRLAESVPGLRSSERPIRRSRDMVQVASLDTSTDYAGPSALQLAVQQAVQEAVGQAAPPQLQQQPQRQAQRQAAPQMQYVSISAPASEPVASAGPATLKQGDRLVQLGAFDSEATAQQEWTRVSANFGPYLGGKQPLIQQTSSGGRTFYRLRVAGFEGLNDSRRFCSVLLAGKAACIPVIAR